MSIRLKLLLPLIFLAVAIGGLLQGYWFPQYKSIQLTKINQSEQAYVEMLATSLVPAILSADLALIHQTLNTILVKKDNWKFIELKDAQGIVIYPLDSDYGKSSFEMLSYEIHEGDKVGVITIYFDLEGMLVEELNQFERLEIIILLIILTATLFVGIFLDTWVRRPIDLLAKASIKLADGEFEITLKKNTNDEIGSLIESFSKMQLKIQSRENKLKRQQNMFSAIGQILSLYIRDIDRKDLFDILLTEVIEFTESEFGFIGEVLKREDGTEFLKIFSSSNILWEKETGEHCDKSEEPGLEYCNLDSLFCAAITSKDIVISNDPENDHRDSIAPVDHSTLVSFLGVPLKRGKEVIAMFGVANRKDGYKNELVSDLKPLINACTNIIESHQNNQLRIFAENEIKEREIRISTILHSVVDAIITTNDKGVIKSFNRSAEKIFGYTETELKGENISLLVPSEHQDQHDNYIKDYLNGKESQIIGIGREVSGQKKDGSQFPAEVAITEMNIGGERHFCVAARDITERKRIDKIKKEFISNVSHELRTPLTSIRGSLGLLSSGTIVEIPEEAKNLLHIAENNTERLLHLINDILDVEKIESGEMRFDNKIVDICEILEKARVENQAYADQYRVFISINTKNQPVLIDVDPSRMMQIMANLISNAAKFSDPDTTIDISVETDDNNMILKVTDYGCGIPEDFKQKVFEKFTQSDASSTRKVGGTGLGLSITKAIIEKQNGKLSFESEENIGTTFTVTLPKVVHGLTDEESQIEKENNYKKVLIIEYDEDTAEYIKKIFSNYGFFVDIANSTEMARNFIEQTDYSIITINILFPNNDGLSLLSELNDDKKIDGSNLILISSHIKENNTAKKLQGISNSFEFIEKPIDREKLEEIIIRYSQKYRKNILYIEDDKDIAKVLRTLLIDYANVDISKNVEESKKKLDHITYDLILLDWKLPDGLGSDIIDYIAIKNISIPVVVFCAKELNSVPSNGIREVIIKSTITNNQLVDKIRKYFN